MVNRVANEVLRAYACFGPPVLNAKFIHQFIQQFVNSDFNSNLDETAKPLGSIGVEGKPNSFYIKTVSALSPLPIYLLETVAERGLCLPEYIPECMLRWHHSVTS